MSWADQERAYREFMRKAEEHNRKEKAKADAKRERSKKASASRTVQFVEPGHTRVTYANRILDIKFKETDKAFAAKKKRHAKAVRQRNESRNGPKKKTYRAPKDEYSYRRDRDLYMDEMISDTLSVDGYDVPEMRALLKDEHWEEVCNHTRWKYDDKSLVREFRKYLDSRGYRHNDPNIPHKPFQNDQYINSRQVIQKP